MDEGGTETYTINDKNYEVEVLYVSGEGAVRLMINDQTTSELTAGEEYLLKDGSSVVISEIAPVQASEPANEVMFYLGANKIELSEVFEPR